MEKLDLTPAERRSLRYCTYCPKLCRHACPVAHGEASETVTPWAKMRLLHMFDQGHVEVSDTDFVPLFHCTSCGRCQVYCRHDNPVAEVLRKGRAQLVAAGYSVPAGFAEAVQREGAEVMPSEGRGALLLLTCVDDDEVTRAERALAVLARRGVELHLKRLAGCSYYQWEVGWADEASRYLRNLATSEQVVTDAGSLLWAFASELRRARHLVDLLHEHLDQLVGSRPGSSTWSDVVVHDASFETRRLGLDEKLRQIVERLCGVAPRSLYENRLEARSLGEEGVWAEVHREAQQRAARMVAQDVLDSGSELVVTSSSRSRSALRAALREMEEPPEVYDLLDLVVALDERSKRP